jgi:hypothetical protein
MDSIKIYVRCYRQDGAAVTQETLDRLGCSIPFPVEGVGEEERSTNLQCCALRRGDFKGRGCSERFYGAIAAAMERLVAFLNSIDEGACKKLQKEGVLFDLLFSFGIEDNRTDYKFSTDLVAAASRLDMPVNILVDPAD